MPDILVVGAADTGRAPITAALLRRLLDERGAQQSVESAGVLGHDDEPPTDEAQLTMEQMGLDIGGHRARSLTQELADGAGLLLAIDSGVARVVRARFPEAAARTHTLGELAGRPRDIPDPFKMQLGAWLAYTREIEEMLRKALPRMLALLGGEHDADSESASTEAPGREGAETAEAGGPGGGDEPEVEAPAPTPPLSPERTAAAGRILRLLDVLAQMPGVVDWPAARAQILGDLEAAAASAGPGDLADALGGLVRAALAVTPATPTLGQLEALREAAERLNGPVDQAAISVFSGQLARWTAL